MRNLITGGLSFLRSHLWGLLMQSGEEVIRLNNYTQRQKSKHPLKEELNRTKGLDYAWQLIKEKL